jgi:hypothetical protein
MSSMRARMGKATLPAASWTGCTDWIVSRIAYNHVAGDASFPFLLPRQDETPTKHVQTKKIRVPFLFMRSSALAILLYLSFSRGEAS